MNPRTVQVTVPDIGDFESVDVIEILVKEGDPVSMEDPLITLESEKATMDIPAPQGGVVRKLEVSVGDQVSEGSLIVVLEADDAASASGPDEDDAAPRIAVAPTRTAPERVASAPSNRVTEAVLVPDLGEFENVDVIEILVNEGDTVAPEAALVTLESEKATMDIPAQHGGRIVALEVKVGDKVSAGSVIAQIERGADVLQKNHQTTDAGVFEQADVLAAVVPTATPPPAPAVRAPQASKRVHASPGVRKFARELGVDLSAVQGSGPKARILKSDVSAYVKHTLTSSADAGGTLQLAPAAAIDFSRYGEVETIPLSKIRRLTGQNLHRSWVSIPHVTQFDQADITDLEDFRKAHHKKNADAETKLTLLAFLSKAVARLLVEYPDFNSSLAADGEHLIRKHYYNLGIAVNTDRGLVVPVIRAIDGKGVVEIAHEIRALTDKARNGELTPQEMQGACFTISNLGPISGTYFSPIINPPEVAILGISPARLAPVYSDGDFHARLMLPLSLSYDHRVIDGVAGAQFTRRLAEILGDIRTLIL